MENKKLVITLSLVVAVLLAGVIYTVTIRDNDGPVIYIDDSHLSYREGDAIQTLLAGVTAVDAKDGDVSSMVIVDRVVPLSDRTRAKVIYVARDLSNNITTSSREIDYEELARPVAEAEENEEEASATVKARVTPRPTPYVVRETETESEEENQDVEELSLEIEVDDQKKLEDKRMEETVAEAEEEPVNTVNQAEIDAINNLYMTNAETMKNIASANHTGSVELSTGAVTIRQGETFNPYDYLQSATIDGLNVKDKMHIANTVNSNVPGTYIVSYAAYADDGYTTEMKTIMVTVE